MSKLISALQIILGAMLVVFGSNKFLEFIPAFEFTNPNAGIFFGALADSYVLKTVGIIEMIVGFLLLLNKFIPFALVVLAPISINIILFHVTLDPVKIAPGMFVFFANSFLIFKNQNHYKTLF